MEPEQNMHRERLTALRRSWQATLALGLLLGHAAVATAQSDPGTALVERGRYLATAGNCISCHTRPGGAPFAGGLPFVTPFGTLYSTNITAHPETGIGQWSQEQFVLALREGLRPDGQHLYPAFPYTAFTRISDEDAAALFAYFRTVAPVNYRAPDNELGFPYNQRWLLAAWKMLYFEEGRFVPEAAQSAEWNRGAYLTQGLGHCSSCHTPRNFLGAEDMERAFTGGSHSHTSHGRTLDWSATNLTSAPSGLGAWSTEDLVSYLKHGMSPQAGVFGPMNEVVLNSTRHLEERDLRAMAVYLKSLPAQEPPAGPPPSAETMRAGEVLYTIHCGTCHLPTGLGSDTTGPPMVGSSVTLAADPASLINITLHGPDLPGESPSPEWQARRWQMMEPYGAKLSDEEVAVLLTFVRNAWGNRASAVDAKQVGRQR
jgi:mono/diheme cytochrome c family protein